MSARLLTFGLLCIAVVVSAGCAGSAARAGETMNGSASKPVMVMAGKEKWAPMEGMKGVQIAQLSGDMTKHGPYVIRLLIAGGTKFPPHTHPDTEQVTVLSGTLSIGLGKKMDASKTSDLGAGSFAEIPAGLAHYAVAKTKVEIEIHGAGPFGEVLVK